MRDVSIRLYEAAAVIARRRGIIIADTKFEFGLDEHGTLTLMDEVLTPDSSRFWPAEDYEQAFREGRNPPSYDKQFVRDWLEQARIEGQPWNKRPPAAGAAGRGDRAHGGALSRGAAAPDRPTPGAGAAD